MGARQIAGALAAAGLITGIPATSLWSQETLGGLQLTFGVNSSLRAHSNLGLDASDPGPTYRSDTALSFGLSSETRTQRLEFSLGAVLRAEDGPNGSETSITDPTLTFGYRREMARSQFAFDASYRQSDLTSETLVFDPSLGTSSLITDSGTRRDASWEGELALGTTGPFGVTLTLGQRFLDYDDITSTALFDRRISSGSIDTELTFSPVLTGTGRLFASRYEADDATSTERDTIALSFGVLYEPDARTEIVAAVGGRYIDDSVAGTSDGAELDLSYTRALPRGSFTIRGDRELTPGGVRDEVEVSRLFEFPLSEIEIALGVARTDTVDAEPTFALRYSRELARGELTAELARTIAVTSQADVQQLTTASLDYAHLFTQSTQFSLGVQFVDVADIGGTGFIERQRGSVTATVNHELTRDWTLSVGASRRFLEESGTTTWDSAVFAGVNRTFSVRP